MLFVSCSYIPTDKMKVQMMTGKGFKSLVSVQIPHKKSQTSRKCLGFVFNILSAENAKP